MAKISPKIIGRVLLVSACTMILPPAAALGATDSPAIRILLDRAKAQAQSGHLDIAASTWKQVLISEPNNMEALRNLASVEAQLGHQQESDGYIQRLKRLGASSTEIGQLQGMRARPSDGDLLKQAASFSKAGQYSPAMEIYRKLYGNNPPAGQIALVYYDTEAATPSDRSHAIEGLRRLAQQFPSDERYPITLGRVLTYDAATRQEGMAILQRYPSDVTAQSALKQAEQWNQRAKVAPPVTVAATPSPAPRTPARAPSSELASGFRALNSGNLPLAEQHFRASLAHESTSGQAYAGLGFVSMRQQNFDQAVQQFERARAEGDRDPGVSQALETSRFWQMMGSAQASLDTNNNDMAIAQYQKALAMKPDNADALTALGGTLLRVHRPKEAIPYLQQAVRIDAKSLPAWRALFLSQSEAGLRADAVQTAELTPAELRAKLESDVEFLGALATDYGAVGQQVQSDRILKRALALVQTSDGSDASFSKQLQYASLMMAAKRYNSAVRGYRRVLVSDPNNSDAWRGLVSAEHLGGRDEEALRAFQQMPPEVSSAAQTNADFLSMLAGIYQSQSQTEAARSALQRAIRIHPSLALQLQLASVEIAGGDKESAVRLYQRITDEHPDSKRAWTGYIQGLHAAGHDREALSQIQEMPEDINSSLQNSPDYLQAAAAVYSASGNTRRAAETIDRLDDIYSEQGISPPASVQIQEGWLYLQAGANTRLSDVIQQLNSEDDLTPDQQEELSRLWTSWALKRAAQLRQQGRPQAAVLILATALRAFPSDVSVNNALADTYVEAGDPKRAVLLYAREEISQADKAICASAVRAALAAGNRKQAEAWLQSSLERFGRDAEILQLAAEFEQQRGDSKRAAAYYRAALQASGPPTIDELTSPQARSSNASQLSATQELFGMLSSAGNAKREALSPERGSFDDGQALWPTRPSSRGSRQFNLDQSVKTENSLVPLNPRRTSRRDPDDSDWSSLSTDAISDSSGTLPALKPTGKPRQSAPSTIHPVFGSDDADSDRQLDTIDRPPARQNSPPPNSSPSVSSGRITTTQSLADDDPLPANPLTSAPHSNAWLPSRSSQRIDSLDSPQSVAMLTAPPAPVESLPPLTGSAVVVPRQVSPREDMEQHLDAIQTASSPYIGGRSWVGFHSGQPGFDRLTLFTADIEQSSMIANGARLSVIVHPTLLQGGTTGSNATFQLGTLPAGAVAGAQSSAGVGGELQLRTRSFGAAIGYTPHGFLVENVTGRLLVQPDSGPVTVTFDRQPIEDSQLSYAGLRDPGSISSNYSGNIWGGVIANAGSIQINRGDASSGWYIAGGGQYITGQHIRSNTRIDGYAGAYWSTWEKPEYGKLTVGMNLFGMHFANNQRLFTYGNGGYFSPGAYLLSNVPVTFEGHYGTRFHYRAAGSIGLQAFQEDAAPYYPLDPGLQIANNNPYLPERTGVGANYNMEADGSYLMNEHWHVGGFFTVDNSRDYMNSRVGFYLRYVTHPQSLDSTMGPTGLDRRTGLRPLLIP